MLAIPLRHSESDANLPVLANVCDHPKRPISGPLVFADMRKRAPQQPQDDTTGAAESEDKYWKKKGKGSQSGDVEAIPVLRNTSRVDWFGIGLRAALAAFVVLLLYSKLGGTRKKAAETRRFVESFFEGPFAWSPTEDTADPILSPDAMAGMALPKRKLGNTGLEVSILGFGASPLGNVFGDLKEADGIEAVHEAIKLGINFIDVSP